MDQVRGQTNWKFLAEIIGVVCVAAVVAGWLYYAWQARLHETSNEDTTANADMADLKIFNGNNVEMKNSGGSADVETSDNASSATTNSGSKATLGTTAGTGTTTSYETTNTVSSDGESDPTIFGDGIACTDCSGEDIDWSKVLSVNRSSVIYDETTEDPIGFFTLPIEWNLSDGYFYIQFTYPDANDITNNISSQTNGVFDYSWLIVSEGGSHVDLLKIEPKVVGESGDIVINTPDPPIQFKVIIK